MLLLKFSRIGNNVRKYLSKELICGGLCSVGVLREDFCTGLSAAISVW
jgi:hypothetical protein